MARCWGSAARNSSTSASRSWTASSALAIVA
jgi:hypothetical protein